MSKAGVAADYPLCAACMSEIIDEYKARDAQLVSSWAVQQLAKVLAFCATYNKTIDEILADAAAFESRRTR